MNEADTIELMIRENRPDGWREEIGPTDDFELFKSEVKSMVKRHGADSKGSYQTVIKVNGGYGDNKETGLTIDLNWTNRLEYIWDILRKAPRVREVAG